MPPAARPGQTGCSSTRGSSSDSLRLRCSSPSSASGPREANNARTSTCRKCRGRHGWRGAASFRTDRALVELIGHELPAPQTVRDFFEPFHSKDQDEEILWSGEKSFSAVTNRKGDGLEIIQWRRLKAGTIEHVHHVVVNELAGGWIRSKWVGAKAGWFRANTILYNPFSALKRLTLPEEFATARPKRLRFVLFNVVGRVVSHARELLMKMTREFRRILFDRSRLRIHLHPAN